MSQTVIMLSKMSAVGLSVKLLFCFVCLSDCRLQGQQFNEGFQTAHSPAASSSSKAIWYKAVVNYFENILYTQYSIHTERKLHLSKPRHAGVLRNYCHYTMHVVNLFWCCCLMQTLKFFQTSTQKSVTTLVLVKAFHLVQFNLHWSSEFNRDSADQIVGSSSVLFTLILQYC